MLKQAVRNIKNAYLTPFGIAINGLTILFLWNIIIFK